MKRCDIDSTFVEESINILVEDCGMDRDEAKILMSECFCDDEEDSNQ